MLRIAQGSVHWNSQGSCIRWSGNASIDPRPFTLHGLRMGAVLALGDSTAKAAKFAQGAKTAKNAKGASSTKGGTWTTPSYSFASNASIRRMALQTPTAF